MANIRLSKITLKDQWPGPVNPNYGTPTDGWAKNDGTAPAYPVGQKRMGYTDNTKQPGMYTMIYGTLACQSESSFDISADFSDGKCWCAHVDMTEDVSHAGDPTYRIANPDGTSQHMYVMHQCVSDALTDYTNSGGVCVPCCSASGYDHLWFWCGGVCPCKDVTIMDESDTGEGCDMSTDGNVYGGGNLFLDITAKSAVLTSEFTLTSIELSLGAATQLVTPNSFGWATAADA
jgi:hypothetical protein